MININDVTGENRNKCNLSELRIPDQLFVGSKHCTNPKAFIQYSNDIKIFMKKILK